MPLVLAGATSGSTTIQATDAVTTTLTLPSTSGTLATTTSLGGGATTTSSGSDITLTSSSTKVQNVSLTANYLSIILPDATTLSGGSAFVINNTGNFSCFIKANGGAILYWLGPQNTVTFTVSDVSTAQGKWIFQSGTTYAPKYIGQYLYSGFDTNSANNATNANMVDNQSFVVQQLTSTTMFIAWKRYSNNSIYGVVATNSGGTLSYGTVTLLYDGSSTACTYFTGRMLSSTAGIMTFDTASGAYAKGITISGTSISVGTAAAAFGSPQSGVIVAGIAAMDSTNCLVTFYNSATVLIARNIIYNGASAPTLGTASSNITITYSGPQSVNSIVPLTATTAQIWYVTAGNSNITAMSTRIVTISGSSAPTLGTAISYTVSSGLIAHVVGSYSATETFSAQALNNQGAQNIVLSFSISGTTVTIQNNRYIGQNQFATNSSTPFSSFTKVDSTSYLSVGALFSGYISKFNYITGDNLYTTGTSDQSIMAGIYGAPYSTFNTAYANQVNIPNGAMSNSQSSLQITSIIPYIASAIQMFSGSSTTGIIVGFGSQNTSASNGTAVAIPIAQVFTIL